jgi:hypothetical protein
MNLRDKEKADGLQHDNFLLKMSCRGYNKKRLIRYGVKAQSVKCEGIFSIEISET